MLSQIQNETVTSNYFLQLINKIGEVKITSITGQGDWGTVAPAKSKENQPRPAPGPFSQSEMTPHQRTGNKNGPKATTMINWFARHLGPYIHWRNCRFLIAARLGGV